eukprot:3284615-Rhodomonas_salina.1
MRQASMTKTTSSIVIEAYNYWYRRLVASICSGLVLYLAYAATRRIIASANSIIVVMIDGWYHRMLGQYWTSGSSLVAPDPRSVYAATRRSGRRALTPEIKGKYPHSWDKSY